MNFESVLSGSVQRTPFAIFAFNIAGTTLLIVGLYLILSSPLIAAEITAKQMLNHPEQIQKWIGKNDIRFEQIPNPHWNDNSCVACHQKKPVGKKLFLRGKSVDELCEYCHSGKFDHSYIHPNEVNLTPDMQSQVPKDFAQHLEAGKMVVCGTCHEIQLQCLQKHKSEKRTNSLFLRGAPYRARTDICYQCHDVKSYKRRNAHDQIDDKGKLQEHTCLICHDKLKGLEDAKSISEVGFYYKESLVRMCASCHELKAHPSSNFSFTKKGTPDHLVVPPENIRKKMLQSEKERDVILPLDPKTGRVFCGTCHNPHEKGVIKQLSAAKGADEKNRLRTQNICTNCHDK